MSLNTYEEPLSDDEIFIGKLTLKELKKHILWDKQLSSNPVSAVNSPKKNLDTSLKILQTHSQPNLRIQKSSFESDASEFYSSEWDNNNDSFVQMENMVEELCVSSTSIQKPVLNNTLEVIEYILNNPPKKDENPDVLKRSEYIDNKDALIPLKQENKLIKSEKVPPQNIPEPPQNTPIKNNKKAIKQEIFLTPRSTPAKPVFKTPGQPLSIKKPSSSSKTPGKSNAYQHITSPVASYIKNCPIAPLVKDVHPRKPLPGPSSIPKLKTLPVKPSNKENVNLPTVAYKSAKKTKVIHVPEEKRLPQCQWAKKLLTSLPRPLVMKHDHRELNFAKRKLLPQQEDSFADLSLKQAEVSVCMQKSAFKSNNV